MLIIWFGSCANMGKFGSKHIFFPHCVNSFRLEFMNCRLFSQLPNVLGGTDSATVVEKTIVCIQTSRKMMLMSLDTN